jgi:putative endonuclease
VTTSSRHSGLSLVRRPGITEAESRGVLCLSPCQPPARHLGITSDLPGRIHQHKTKAASGFTSKYGVDRLVWFETHDDPAAAIAREKALKRWRRDCKIRLIEEQNPEWRDLFPAIIG